MNLGQREQMILDYMKKYAHSEWYVINETSGDITGEGVKLLEDVEADASDIDFQDVSTGEFLGIGEFRKYVFPEILLEQYERYINGTE